MLRMRLVYIRPRLPRQVSFDFMNQQLVWHGVSVSLLESCPSACVLAHHWLTLAAARVSLLCVMRHARV